MVCLLEWEKANVELEFFFQISQIINKCLIHCGIPSFYAGRVPDLKKKTATESKRTREVEIRTVGKA